MALIDQQEAAKLIRQNKDMHEDCQGAIHYNRGCEHSAQIVEQMKGQEIIHCKDCKYWKEKPLYTYCEKMYGMGILDVFDYATEENDFCSMAEKRGGEDDETDCDYERAVEQLEHDMLYEPTFNKDDGSM